MNNVVEINNNYLDLSKSGMKIRKDLYNKFYWFVKKFCDQFEFYGYKEQYFVIMMKNLIDFFVSSLNKDDVSSNYKEPGVAKLAIIAPPRFGKSFLCTVLFPIWALNLNPKLKFIIFSDTKYLAGNHLTNCKMILHTKISEMNFLPVKKSIVNCNRRIIQTNEGGYIQATSLRCGAIGIGADFIIIDDPHNSNDILNRKKLLKTQEWFKNSVFTRFNRNIEKKCGIIIVMQRLHKEDLIGSIKNPAKWNLIKLQLITEENKEYIVFDEKFLFVNNSILGDGFSTLEEIDDLRQSMNDEKFQAQYQQNPIDYNLGYIKKEMLIYCDNIKEVENIYGCENHTSNPYNNMIVHSWDIANSVNKGDYSACTTWKIVNNKYCLIDVKRFQMSYHDIKKVVYEQYNQYGGTILIEDTTTGTALIDELRKDPLGIPVFAIKPKKSKVQRLLDILFYFERGDVIFINNNIYSTTTNTSKDPGFLQDDTRPCHPALDAGSLQSSSNPSLTNEKIQDHAHAAHDDKLNSESIQYINNNIYSITNASKDHKCLQDDTTNYHSALDTTQNVILHSIQDRSNSTSLLQYDKLNKQKIITRNNSLQDFEREIMTFPFAQNDDQVDSMTQFLNWIKEKTFVNKNIHGHNGERPRVSILI